MEINDPFLHIPVVETAIERDPLVVSPQTSLSSAIALIYNSRSSSCLLDEETLKSDFEPASNCVLVIQAGELVGILTARDIVRLSVAETDFQAVAVEEVMAHPVVTLSLAAFEDLFAAVFLLRRYRIRHLPIVDDEGQVIGVVSPESIRRSLHPANLLKLRRVADVMSTNAIHAPMSASVFTIAQLMVEHRISCVVITHTQTDKSLSGERIPVGIITERDIVQFQALGVNMNGVRAQDVMSTPLFLLHPEDSLWKAHQQMQQRRVQRLVVSWDWGKGLGILTQTSLLRIFDPVEMYGVIQSLQRTVEQLQSEKFQLLQDYQTLLVEGRREMTKTREKSEDIAPKLP
ncbi:CBS domain-containing protein [Merismopedia glauca]|uniref:Histidine kinase n=1 Tax=Merismopedia glauca CCAP 1448/3 TaxID=1296344 RepID=A0A2T1C5X3_9CYAN|nr:CBS domain-containing protein [Merismopedia glauca]PSB03661.1 histidine kinase [Merismopedia glauca CCAP 1448/3]